MSRFYGEISSIDTMPSHIDTPSRVIGRTVRKTGFESRVLFQDQDRLNLQPERNNCLENPANQSLKPSSVQSTSLRFPSQFNEDFSRNKSSTSRTFGLQAWNHFGSSGTRSHLENNLSLNQKISDQYHSSTILGVSKTFGLVSENLSCIKDKDNEISNSYKRGNPGVNLSVMPRTFGLQSKNLTINSQFFSGNNLRGNLNSDVNHRKFNNEKLTMPSMSKSVWGSERVGGLNELNNEGFIQDLRRHGSVNSSFMCRPFENQLKNSTMHSNFLSESNGRLTQNSHFRSNNNNNNFTTTCQTLGPELRNSTITTESHVQDSEKFNNEIIDNSEFKRPSLSRVIRGRNSVLSSRLFNHQNMERHCRNLSNINGFNVSHISRRDVDAMSESRLALNMRSNYADNQSIAGSTMSGVSMKAQFLNLLENLHHSILNIGPHMTAEAVRMEFDKAKQGLENLSEVSFAPSIKELDANSVISQSSKYKCPPINGPSKINVIDGGSLHLKSSQEVLKALMCSKNSQKKMFNLSTHVEEEGKETIAGRASSHKHSDDEEDLQFPFKKPKPYSKRKKSLNSTKTKAVNTTAHKIEKSQAGKNLISEKTSKAVSLKEWYPVVFGSDLAFCGVNEEGITVKTDPVKKRLNCRKVELINGIYCNLIGSPSTTVSVLPEKIAKLLKNGLTDRWRVLQKELLNCQVAITKQKKRESKSSVGTLSPPNSTPRGRGKNISKNKSKGSKIVSSPRKFEIKPLSVQKIKSKSPKIETSPKKGEKDVFTRSGRTVKPPAMYWLVVGKEELNSTHEPALCTVSTNKRFETPAKKADKTNMGPDKKRRKKKANDSVTKNVKVSRQKPPEKLKTPRDESICKTSKRNTPKVITPKGSAQKTRELKAIVQSLSEDAERPNRGYETRNKRKREVAGDNDSVQTKKSKLEKKLEVEIKSPVKETEPIMKKEKKIKAKGALQCHLSKSIGKKSPAKKNKKPNRKEATKKNEKEGKKEKKDLNEFEEDFELQLDNIEIPEIANVSGNPKLSKSQMRLISMETPPLKYFNSNLRLFGSATPIKSPNWCISQRTESEVKRFQKRREDALKKRTKTGVKKIIMSEKTTKTVQNKDLKRVMEWVTEKTVKSPVWKSKVLQYVMPSRRQMEQQDDEAEEDEDIETEFLKPSFI